jgi:hypothetical protein
MNRRLTRIAFAGAIAASLSALLASSAAASFHENLIRQVHEGSGGNGDYVELQAYAAGQNFVANKYVALYDGGGGLLDYVTIPSNLPNGANQASILVAHDASTTGADVINSTLNVDNTNGYACYEDQLPPTATTALDCVSWGQFAPGFLPSLSPTGTPALNNPTGFPDNTSLTRSIARGCATALDPADDTNNSAADFAVTTRTPRSNSQTPTEVVCPPSSTTPKKKKCKKKKHRSAESAKKKKCKKKKHH